ncbi:MAG: NAD-dependent epimerase/dehydratase family protein [Gammaproteobacteria bacterium]|nr:NAD-dependent epimerase/dehydratase family protein [Sideroxydans sp.]MBU3903136.1 NAD-dependent epimerase/dehydratase family protein [Gammaproteobacteria bacterium]MBU4044845.1 NAD-dependent epimerase/dehydratase family protein [Gammaproteobacteria bacterium]
MSRVIAITGATGFIGRHLVARHVALGDEVRYLTRSADSAPLSGAIRHVGDLGGAADDLQGFLRGADVLYHCAAELQDASRMEGTNVAGTRNLLQAAQGEVGRWVQLSSTGVYGLHRGGEVDEDTGLRPGNAYERSKAAADALVLDAAVGTALPCVLLRPSNVYGADMSNRSLFQLIRMIDKGLFFFIGQPGAAANYIHVENVVDALLACGEAALPQNGRTYIVSDHCMLEDFVGIIAARLGRSEPRLRLPLWPVHAAASLCGSIPGFPLKPSRVAALTDRTIYRTDRIVRELGYRNRITLEQGVGGLVDAWRQKGALDG